MYITIVGRLQVNLGSYLLRNLTLLSGMKNRPSTLCSASGTGVDEIALPVAVSIATIDTL
jgi:hypothetical protein